MSTSRNNQAVTLPQHLLAPLLVARVSPSMIGGVAILLSVPLRWLVGESQAWHEFARWVIA
jgi:hypothetical protein